MRVSPNTENRTSKTSESPKKETSKRASKSTGKPDQSENDTEVTLSTKTPKSSKTNVSEKPAAKKTIESQAPAAADKEISEAETLMSHVNSGKLTEQERELAMGRVGDLLKKYDEAGKPRA